MQDVVEKYPALQDEDSPDDGEPPTEERVSKEGEFNDSIIKLEAFEFLAQSLLCWNFPTDPVANMDV